VMYRAQANETGAVWFYFVVKKKRCWVFVKEEEGGKIV